MLETMADRAEDQGKLPEEAEPAQGAPETEAGRCGRWRKALEPATTVASSWYSAVVIVVGLALTAIAVGTFVFHSTPDGRSEALAPAPAAERLIHAHVGTAELVYEQGHSSAWHVHAGVHAVVVLSGTLTVYDEACRRENYAAGQTYLGGRAPHLALNTGSEPAYLVVTYVLDGAAGDSPGHPVPAPSGCVAGN